MDHETVKKCVRIPLAARCLVRLANSFGHAFNFGATSRDWILWVDGDTLNLLCLSCSVFVPAHFIMEPEARLIIFRLVFYITRRAQGFQSFERPVK